jgi:peptidoglycan/LPS O-acetylase OafA/YrhL
MTGPSLPTPGATERVATLDGIRGVAILLVLFRHGVVFGDFVPQSTLDALFNVAAKSAWVGVDLFFVLSGFLITGILFETKDRTHYFRAFYARRALRIVPAYYVFLLLYFLAAPAVLPEREAPRLDWTGLGWAASFLSNYPTGYEGWGVLPHPVRHVWSLAIEEQFYLVWPLLVLWLPRRRLMAACVAAVVLAWLFRAWLATASLPIAGYVWTPARLGPLALGALVALALRDPTDLRTAVRWARPVALATFLLVVAIVLWRRDLAYSDPVVQLIAYDAVGAMFAALIVIAVSTPSAVTGRLLSSPILMFLGRYSYATYLYHQPVLLSLAGVGITAAIVPPIGGERWPGALAFVIVGAGVSVALAYASWHLVEKHALKLKDRFAYV